MLHVFFFIIFLNRSKLPLRQLKRLRSNIKALNSNCHCSLRYLLLESLNDKQHYTVYVLIQENTHIHYGKQDLVYAIL